MFSRHTTVYQCIVSQDAPTKSVRHYISQEIKDSEQGPVLVSSVRGQANSITVHEIAKMGVPEFASLWAVRWLTCSQRLSVCICTSACHMHLSMSHAPQHVTCTSACHMHLSMSHAPQHVTCPIQSVSPHVDAINSTLT